ncbi:hypothetical protein J1605_005176 [Eschrichtius robustus]|uniref:Uncharacterized protein n=1 Tax=Eschrichtius robustus TaxID=9764 RepID=A0AB34HDP1_ESCRO|nr:hypothetical protein J1605_005176 [Eschrichtius robustus]
MPAQFCSLSSGHLHVGRHALWSVHGMSSGTLRTLHKVKVSRWKTRTAQDASWASLVAQWLRICLPMQGTRVRALVWEDPTCRGATGPLVASSLEFHSDMAGSRHIRQAYQIPSVEMESMEVAPMTGGTDARGEGTEN